MKKILHIASSISVWLAIATRLADCMAIHGCIHTHIAISQLVLGTTPHKTQSLQFISTCLRIVPRAHKHQRACPLRSISTLACIVVVVPPSLQTSLTHEKSVVSCQTVKPLPFFSLLFECWAGTTNVSICWETGFSSRFPPDFLPISPKLPNKFGISCNASVKNDWGFTGNAKCRHGFAKIQYFAPSSNLWTSPWIPPSYLIMLSSPLVLRTSNGYKPAFVVALINQGFTFDQLHASSSGHPLSSQGGHRHVFWSDTFFVSIKSWMVYTKWSFEKVPDMRHLSVGLNDTCECVCFVLSQTIEWYWNTTYTAASCLGSIDDNPVWNIVYFLWN